MGPTDRQLTSPKQKTSREASFNRLLRLTLLAPNIQEAIFEGR
jgi:hypothetical protein